MPSPRRVIVLAACATLLLLNTAPAQTAAPEPTGPHTWIASDGRMLRAMGSNIPINYRRDDGIWERIDPNWEQSAPSEWRVVRGDHRVFACDDGSARYVMTRNGARHILGTCTERLVKFNRADSTWDNLAAASPDSATAAGNLLTFHNIFPGVDKVLEYGRAHYSERFIFHETARDFAATCGPWLGCLLGVATRLDTDSLDLSWRYAPGSLTPSESGCLTDGWLAGTIGDTTVFAMRRAWLWSESGRSDVPVHKWLGHIGDGLWLVELFSPVAAADLPSTGDWWHNATFGKDDTTGFSTLITIENQIIGLVAAPPSDGTADSVSVYLQLGGSLVIATVNCALYDRDSADALLDTTDERTVAIGDPDDDTWYDFVFGGGGPSLSAGRRYLISAWSTASALYSVQLWMKDPSTGDQVAVDAETYGGWPDPLAAVNLSNRCVAIYCYYTETALSPDPRRRRAMLEARR